MSRHFCVLAVGIAGVLSFAAVGCNDGDDSGSGEPQQVDVGVTEGGAGEITFPAKLEGGVVELSLDNSGNKAEHSAQVVRLDDGHTFEDAAKVIGSEEPVEIPEWLRGYGGVGETDPGKTRTTTIVLDEGHYAIFDDAGEGQPPVTEFDVTGDGGGDLPDTDATVTAATTGEDDPEYEWEVEGLKAGENIVTFDSEGEEALHHIVALPIKGDATFDEVKAELESDFQGPPQTIAEDGGDDTSVIDGERSEVTTLTLEPGRYVFACFLTDRDEPDKPHVKEGLLKEVTIEG
jgi:hypothetical protein